MADIGIKIGLEGVSQYNGDLSSIEKKTKLATNRMGKSFGQLADEIPLVGQAIRLLSNPIVAVVAAISGAGIAVVSFIDKAAGAEKVKASFEVLTGSIEVAESTLKSLAKFAASTPFQLPRIQDSARKLLAFGTAADDVTGVLKRIGDVSAGVDAPLNELSEIYGKIQVQGRVFAEDINQLTGRGIPVIQELAKQFGVADSEVKKLVEQGKVGFPQIEQAFISLTSEGGKFFGLTEKLSGTFSGKLSTLKDNFNQLQITLGQLLLPAATSVLDVSLKLAKSMQNMNQFVFENAEAFSIAATAIAAFVAPSIIAGIGALVTAIRAAATAQGLLNIALSANPIGLVIIAVGALVTAFIALFKRSQTLRAGIAGLGSFFIELGTIIRDGFLKIIEGVGLQLQGIFELDFGLIKQGIKKAIGGILDSSLLTTAFKNGDRLAASFSRGFNDKIDDENAEFVEVFHDNIESATVLASKQVGETAGRGFGQSFSSRAIESIDISNNIGTDITVPAIASQNDSLIFSTDPFGSYISSLIDAKQVTSEGAEFIKSSFDGLDDVFDSMNTSAFNFADSLGASIDRSLQLALVFENFKSQSFETSLDILASATQNVGAQLGEAIKTGAKATGVFRQFVGEIISQGFRYLGLFLLQGAAALGFPAGIPLAIAGIAALGLSGFASGLLGGSGASQQSQNIATPNGNDVSSLSQNSINQAQGANIGLGNIQQGIGRSTQSLVILLDGEEITGRVLTSIEIGNELSGQGG